ncbi:MAG: hypothetical protein R3C29_09635 [Dehalococcoidia bacterium]
MSKLKKAIERAGKRESSPMGFRRVEQEKRRAMLLGLVANDEKEASKAAKLGIDVVLVAVNDGGKAATAFAALGDLAAGAIVNELSNEDAVKLADAGADFIASPFGATAATAVDTNRSGHVISLDGEFDDATLRALATIGLDALLIDRGSGPLTLQAQAKLVRIAQLTATPLLLQVEPSIAVDELRVLRDSGGGGVILPAGTSASDIEAVSERLREVPDIRKRDSSSSNIAVLPSLLGGGHEHDDDEDDPGDE